MGLRSLRAGCINGPETTGVGRLALDSGGCDMARGGYPILDITRMPCAYRQCVTMFTEELPWLRDRDLERVMGGTMVDWLGWKRPAAC